MKRKLSTEQLQARENPVTKALETANRLVAEEQSDLRRRIRELESDNDSMQDTLDAISEILDCDDPDCTEDHLEEIAEILAKGDANTEDE